MGGSTVLVVTCLVVLLVVPAIAVTLNEKRLHRRHRALATRRKQKMRL